MAVALQSIHIIANIGAGTMGHATALQFAAAGYEVRLVDQSEEWLRSGIARIREDLTVYAEHGLLREGETVDRVMERISPTTDYARGVDGADFVIESVAENLDVKHRVWGEVERHAREDAIFATNTSGLSPSELQRPLAHPGRFVVAHFWNPAHLMPLVEVVPGKDTDREVVETTAALMAAIGKRPAVLRRESPGFVGNRIQLTVLREAFHIVEEGIADPQAVDDIVRYSLGRRWNLVGPIASADLGGLDTFYNISTYLFDDMDNSTGPNALLARKVEAGDLGAKTGRGFYPWDGEDGARTVARRDEGLVRALAEDRAQDAQDADQAGRDGGRAE